MICHSKKIGIFLATFQCLSFFISFIFLEYIIDYSIFSKYLFFTSLIGILSGLSFLYSVVKKSLYKTWFAVFSFVVFIGSLIALYINRTTVGFTVVNWNTAMEILRDEKNGNLVKNSFIKELTSKNSLSVLFYDSNLNINTSADKQTISSDTLNSINQLIYHKITNICKNRKKNNNPTIIPIYSNVLDYCNIFDIKEYCKMLNKLHFTKFSNNLIILIKMSDVKNLEKNGFNRKITYCLKTSTNTMADETFMSVEEYAEKTDFFITGLPSEKKLHFCGLKNSGNFCYANSLIQSFYNIPFFKKAVLECDDVSIKHLQDLFISMDTHKVANAKKLIENLSNENEEHRQQDIHEFLMKILRLFQKQEDQKTNEKSENVNRLTKGIYQNTITRSSINYKNVRYDPFNTLEIPISQFKNGVTMEDYLKNFFNKESIEDNDPGVFKELLLEEAPPILCILINRNEYDRKENVSVKLYDKFEFRNKFDITPHMVDKNKQVTYTLHSVCVHQGIKAECGHYYCYIQINKRWYRFNDEVITPVSEFDAIQNNFGGEKNGYVKDNNAYFLIYIRDDFF